ncbi:MAG: glycoside hydrolase [Clostridioides sp.]|jgi:hypothetical protein|nr:glycoside hydrolase [Clostridioides sp.]
MKKVLAFLLSATIVTGMSGCQNKTSETEKISANKNILSDKSNLTKVDNLKFDFDVVPETFKLTVKSDGNEEIVSNPTDTKKVSNLKKTSDEVSWIYPNENINVDIKKNDKYLDVKIKSTIEEENNFEFPSISGKSYTIPMNEGKSIPSDDKWWKERLDGEEFSTIESFSMKFFSVEKENFALTYIIENNFNNTVKFDAKDKIKFMFSHSFPKINKNKEYGFRIYLTKNNIVDEAKTYKNYIVEKGEFKTLEQKSKENENIKKLYGAPFIYFWGESAIEDSDMVWSNFKNEMNDELVAKLKTVLEKEEEKEDANEKIKVFEAIKSQDYIDNYQKSQIVKTLNTVLMSKEFYDEKLFAKDITKNNEKSFEKDSTGNNEKIDNDSIKKLKNKTANSVELVELNKLLLKSKLKKSTRDTKIWGQNGTVKLIEDMKNSGLENAWIGFGNEMGERYISKEFVDKASELGYLIAPYDSYHSIHKPGEEKYQTAAFKDKTLFENGSILNKDGTKEIGYGGVGRQLNPTLSLPSVKQRVGDILGLGYNFNSWFIDCDATGQVYDDYSPEHLTTMSQDVDARLERMSYIKDNKNMIIGSEDGNDFASQVIAFGHGLECPAFYWMEDDMSKNKDSEYYFGRYYSDYDGAPDMFVKPVPLKEKYYKLFIDPTYSIPLYKLVYNDSVITSSHWNCGTFKFKDCVRTRQLKEILYNVPSMYHIDETQWNKYKKQIISHNKIWNEFNKEVANKAMSDFRYLTEDKMVQETIYDGKIKVIANFSDKDYKEDGKNIKSNSLIIDYGDKIVEY